jgi:predicted transcriptional regulator
MFLDNNGAKKKKEIFSHIGLTTQSKNVNNYLIPLVEKGLVQPTFKDSRNSPLQQYFITEFGRKVLNIKETFFS